MNPPVAMIGTSSDRNTTIMMISESPTTTAMYSGSTAARFSEMSMLMAAWPATPSAYSPSTGGRVRRSRTSSSVDTELGPSSGTTWNAARVPSSDTAIGATATTPSRSDRAVAMSSCACSSAVSSRSPGSVADTSSVPLTPAPNASSVSVYAW